MSEPTVQATIEEKLTAGVELAHLEVINESANHNVPAGSSSHFKVVLVAAEFEGQRLLQRHRLVNKLLQAELAGQIHALAIHAFSPAEWLARHGDSPMSPPCLGGGR
jgi:BolA protein